MILNREKSNMFGFIESILKLIKKNESHDFYKGIN